MKTKDEIEEAINLLLVIHSGTYPNGIREAGEIMNRIDALEWALGKENTNTEKRMHLARVMTQG